MDELKRSTTYKKYLKDERVPSPSSQETREIDQPLHNSVQNCFGNSYPVQNHRINLNYKRQQRKEEYLQTIWLTEDGSVYKTMKCADKDRRENKIYNKPRARVENESVQNQNLSTSSQESEDNKYQKPIIYQNKMYDIVNDSSYICELIDDNGMSGMNNLGGNLILRCSPRRHKTSNINQNDEESDSTNIDGYVHPPAETKADMFYNERYRNFIGTSIENPQLQPEKTTFPRLDSIEQPPSLPFFVHERKFSKSYPEEIYGEQRVLRCKRLYKSFKRCLWTLFYTCVLLVVIASILLILALSHTIGKNYVNIVIEHAGFAIWTWILLILSTSIAIVGMYGIFTSIDRSKDRIIAYCTTAFILAFVVLVFLVFLWILFINMKDVQHRSMRNTFKQYRCNRAIRNAWDGLHENFQCCGIEDQEDWKYVPPSCCNATTKKGKMACIKHFISGKQAFNHGCRQKLDKYFTILLTIAAGLLLLALLLLILSILVSLWLLRKYKTVIKCQEIYYVSQENSFKEKY